MEHTDAGVYVGLADTCPPEFAFIEDDDIQPVDTCPAPPETALPPPPRSGDPGVPGGGTAGAGSRAAVVVAGAAESRVDTDDCVAHSGAGHESVACPPVREPVVRLAEVVDLGLAGLFSEPMEWQERALCAQTDPEAFFPEKGGSTREAKRICSGCEVRPQCLEYALANDERFGIWGGMSERERRKQRRRAV